MRFIIKDKKASIWLKSITGHTYFSSTTQPKLMSSSATESTVSAFLPSSSQPFLWLLYIRFPHRQCPLYTKKEYQHLCSWPNQQQRGYSGEMYVVQSLGQRRKFSRYGIHVNAAINSSVDTEKFRPLPTIARNDRCLFIGSSDYYGKGFDILEKLVDMGVKIDCVTSIRSRDTRLGWLESYHP